MHKVLLLLKKIPKGKVVSYGELARVCNTSSRAVGGIMARNENPVECPCYKVVASSGELGGYSGRGGLSKKRELLQRDGIVLERGKVPSTYFFYFCNLKSLREFLYKTPSFSFFVIGREFISWICFLVLHIGQSLPKRTLSLLRPIVFTSIAFIFLMPPLARTTSGS
ncbi:MAG: MGMT family protein, partial [Patescibacteria group bacterium]